MNEATWLASTDPETLLDFVGSQAGERKFRLLAAACCRRVIHLLRADNERALVGRIEQAADGQLGSQDLGGACVDVLRNEFERYSFSPASKAVLAAAGLPAECVQRWLPSGYDLWPQVDPSDERLRLPVAVRLALRHAALALAVAGDPGGFEQAREEALNDPSVDWDNDEQVVAVARRLAGTAPWVHLHDDERRQQAGVLRDLFGNPWRPVALGGAWLTPTVSTLARAVYEHLDLPAGTLDPARLAVLADALEEAGCNDATVLGHLRGPGPHARGCHLLDVLMGEGDVRTS
jgi:hypothetical protein